MRAANPDDPDVAAFDGLAIIEGVDLQDKTYARQKRAGAILEGVMAAHPDHPGAPHYLIHAYDYAALAPQAVHAATVYSAIATASSHAQHMPSHIWSMIGAWDKSIEANRLSGALLDRAASRSAVRGDTVYEHAYDFIAYARLQRGEDRHVAADLASQGRDAPVIVQARYPLERGDWAAAAAVPATASDPFDLALARFTRAYGAARGGDVARAEVEVKALEATRSAVRAAEGEYWALFVDIYAKTARAWLAQGAGVGGRRLSPRWRRPPRSTTATRSTSISKTRSCPMRESLGDMELSLGHPAEALQAYTESFEACAQPVSRSLWCGERRRGPR